MVEKNAANVRIQNPAKLKNCVLYEARDIDLHRYKTKDE